MSKIVVRCGEEWLAAKNLKTLKEFTNLGFSEIGRRIKSSQPLAEFILFLNDYDEIEKLLNRLMRQAEERRLPLELYELSADENFLSIDDRENRKITSQTLRNIFQSGEETRRQIQREDELRFGFDE